MRLSLSSAVMASLALATVTLALDKGGHLRDRSPRMVGAAMAQTGGGPAPSAAPPAPAPSTPIPAAPVPSTSATAADEVETPDVLPQGRGRDETFYACTACHSSAVIRRSGFSRQRWDQLITWMTDTHGMQRLEGEDRERILGYLAEHFAPKNTYTNPFLRK
ncbi:MAG TPA: hypothetical protein VEY95_17670 [Azospirillaceae bacterium]|nr:hypothetical protein [Azospirillaceae bacterium]